MGIYRVFWCLILGVGTAKLQAQPEPRATTHDIWPVDRWVATPDFRWIDTIGASYALLFRGEAYLGERTEVFSYYSNPDIHAGRAPSGQKFPAVVLVHGGSGKAFSQWVEQWASAGYAAIAMDLTGRGADTQPLAHGGPPMTEATMFPAMETEECTNTWVYHSVASVMLAHSILRSFTEVDEYAIGLTGISWGGYLTSLVAALDHRFMAAAPVYGCGFIAESAVFGKQLAKLTPRGRERWLAKFDPSAYMADITVPFLMINGNTDQFYPVVAHAKSAALINPYLRYCSIKPNLAHSYEAAWALTEIRMFFDRVRSGRLPAFPRVTAMDLSPAGVKATLQLPGETAMRAAYFYYTTDTVARSESCHWLRSDVSVDGLLATAEVPRSEYVYGFFHFCIDDSQSFSSELIYDEWKAAVHK